VRIHGASKPFRGAFMFSRKIAILSLLVALPTIASAQRQRSSFGRDAEPNWDELGKGSGGLQLSNKDLENISPLKLLIDKRKDLKLTDDQLTKLKDLDGKSKEQNVALFKTLDSLRKETKPSTRPSDEDRTRIMSARREVSGVVKDIRSNYDASLTQALPVLDESQRSTADGLIQKLNEEAEKMLREKMGRGGASGGAEGGSPSDRRPGRPDVR
jgi:hypothetical protein